MKFACDQNERIEIFGTKTVEKFLQNLEGIWKQFQPHGTEANRPAVAQLSSIGIHNHSISKCT